MAFELEQMTKARVLDVRTLTSKDRKPDEKPGAQLLLRAQVPLGVLAMFDGFLPGMLYRVSSQTAAGQTKLDGMESAELTTIGSHVKRLKWEYDQTGCDIVIDRGMGGRSNVKMDDCKVHRVSFQPKQGGGVEVLWTVDAPGLSDDTRGKLSGMKSTDIEMTIALPKVEPDLAGDKTPPKSSGPTIDGSKGHPGADAAAAAETERQAKTSKEALDASGKNPFGTSTGTSTGTPGDTGEAGKTGVSATEAFIAANRLGTDPSKTKPASTVAEPPPAPRGRRERRVVGAPE